MAEAVLPIGQRMDAMSGKNFCHFIAERAVNGGASVVAAVEKKGDLLDTQTRNQPLERRNAGDQRHIDRAA